MFWTTNFSEKCNMQGFERILYYEQYPEEKSRLWLSSFKKNWSTFTSNRVHIIQIPSAAPFFMGIHLNLHLKSCAYHPDSECCTFFHGNSSQPSPQIVCISSRFRVLHLFSWEFERSEVLWRYADILLCYLKHVEVCWYTRKKKEE